MDFIPSFKVSTVLQDDSCGMWKREGFKAINRNSTLLVLMNYDDNTKQNIKDHMHSLHGKQMKISDCQNE